MPGEVPDLARQLTAMVVLAGCAAMAREGPRPRTELLPETTGPVAPTEAGGLSPEAQEFVRLPSHIRRQVLAYARNWISASFEKDD